MLPFEPALDDVDEDFFALDLGVGVCFAGEGLALAPIGNDFCIALGVLPGFAATGSFAGVDDGGEGARPVE